MLVIEKHTHVYPNGTNKEFRSFHAAVFAADQTKGEQS
jgi:hypothetical protein